MRLPYLSYVFALVLLVAPLRLLAQVEEEEEKESMDGIAAFSFDGWNKIKEDFKIKPFMMLQLWGVYTQDQRIQATQDGELVTDDNGNPVFEDVDDRLNVTWRRARLGFRANPYERLKFALVLNYDHVGRDGLGGSIGGYNNDPFLGIWDAFFQYQFLENSQGLNLVAGFFRPQLGRESITSGWSVNSFEKSMSQTYIRDHLVGRGRGRSMGLNIGGTFPGDGLGFNYNVGLFNPQETGSDRFRNRTTVGTLFAPLLVGRGVLYIGDPEQDKYKIGYKTNYFGERNGLSLGLGGSYQGETDIFETSTSFAADMLLNYGPITIDGEYIIMNRSDARNFVVDNVGEIDYTSTTGHGRAGYSFVVGDQFLEAVGMIMFFEGAEVGAVDNQGNPEQVQASRVEAFSGDEFTYDAGINWYLNKRKLKLMAHYTWRDSDNRGRNAYWRQSRFDGNIQRGDWWGVGLHAIF